MRLFVFVMAVAAAWGRSSPPIAFEPNRGQAPADVEYLSRAGGYSLALRSGAATWIGRGSRITASLIGGRHSRAVPEAPLPGVVNYLARSPAAAHLGVPTYGRIRYPQVYPGIDVVYYGSEYDFVIAPGADPRQIRVRYRLDEQAARGIHLDSIGDLVLETATGTLRQHRPRVYQEIAGARREVAARYVLRGNGVRFVFGSYDHSRQLVIDPVITWSSYFGSASADSGEAVAVDSSGNIYLAGSTISAAGDVNAYVAKLNPAGATTLYTAVFPGSANDLAHAIAVDSTGSAYVAGETSSSDFSADGTYFVPRTANGLPHVFISKLDPLGQTLLYSHYVAGSGSEIAYGVAIDTATNAYITGATNSPDFPVTTGAAQTTRPGGVEAFVMRFDPTGTRIYGTYLGGSGSDDGFAIAADSSGDAFVTGQTNSTNFPVTSSVYQPKVGGGYDAFVAKISPGGTLVFATYLGGTGDDSGSGIAVDPSGATYIAGEAGSGDFPTLKAYQKTFGGGSGDIFVAKLNGDGATLAYSTFLGGTGEDSGNAIAIDSAGNAYFTGSTTSGDLPLANAFQSTNAGVVTAFVAGLDATGSSLLFSSYLGGAGGASASTVGDSGSAVVMNCASGLVVVGTTSSTDFPTTAGTFAPAYLGGGSDAFVAKIAAGGTPTLPLGGVLNSASNGVGPVAPGSLVTVYGSSLAVTTQTASSAPWGISLAGAGVAVNGAAVPLAYGSAGQINFQLPYEARPGVASLTVTTSCGTSAPVSFQVAQAAPYIFQRADNTAIVQNQDLSINGAGNGAKVSSVVTVYLTGIGPLDNPVGTGAAAPTSSLSRATLPVRVTIGNFDTAVQFLGLTPGFIGLAQANLVIPNLSPGQYPIVIGIGGIASNPATIFVQ
jgi:uncharacterized protein (TIGR03437 family)